MISALISIQIPYWHRAFSLLFYIKYYLKWLYFQLFFCVFYQRHVKSRYWLIKKKNSLILSTVYSFSTLLVEWCNFVLESINKQWIASLKTPLQHVTVCLKVKHFFDRPPNILYFRYWWYRHQRFAFLEKLHLAWLLLCLCYVCLFILSGCCLS